MELRKSYRGNILFCFILFCFISIITFFAQNFLPYSDFLEGLFIPDVINMSITIDNIRIGGLSVLSTGVTGVYFIYYIAWIVHPAFSILINLLFVYYSIKLIYEIFIMSNMTSQLVCLGIFINPYVFLAVTGPNKEIPLIWATLYVVRNLIFKPNRWFVKTIIVSVFVTSIRDGYGLILILGSIIFSSKIAVRLMWKIALGIAFLVSVLADILVSNLSVLEKNLLISKSISSDANSSKFIGDFLTNNSNPIFSVIKEVLRMIYNWLTLSMFPVFFTDTGFLYSLGTAYWIFGIFISICLLSSLYVLFSNKAETVEEKNRFKIAGFVVFVWATVSISLFLQPRYLMPILPIAFGILMSIGKMSRMVCVFSMVFFSFSIMTMYFFSGIPQAKLSIENTIEGSVRSDPPFLIFNSKD